MNNSLIGLRQPPYSQCTVGGSTVCRLEDNLKEVAVSILISRLKKQGTAGIFIIISGVLK
jgi:hypothetical protein